MYFIGLLKDRKKDFGASAYDMSQSRASVVDYLPALMVTYQQIFIRNPSEQLDWNDYLRPLSRDTWIVVGGVFFIILPFIMFVNMFDCKFSILRLIVGCSKLFKWFNTNPRHISLLLLRTLKAFINAKSNSVDDIFFKKLNKCFDLIFRDWSKTRQLFVKRLLLHCLPIPTDFYLLLEQNTRYNTKTYYISVCYLGRDDVLFYLERNVNILFR